MWHLDLTQDFLLVFHIVTMTPFGTKQDIDLTLLSFSTLRCISHISALNCGDAVNRRRRRRGGKAVVPPKFGRKKYFSGKHRVVFGQLIYFWKKKEPAPIIF